MEVVFPLQLQPKAPLTEKEAVAEEVEASVAEQLDVPNARLINVLEVNNPKGPIFIFEAKMHSYAILQLTNKISGGAAFSNPADTMARINMEKRMDPDFDLRNHLCEYYGPIFDEYEIKIF